MKILHVYMYVLHLGQRPDANQCTFVTCVQVLKERKGKERKDPLFIEGNTFTSIGCTLPCGPHH